MQVHLNGRKHMDRMTAASSIQSGTIGHSYSCALCCTPFGTAVGLQGHVRSRAHCVRLKTRVLEDTRCTGALYSLHKSGIRVKTVQEGAVNLLQGGSRTLVITVQNSSTTAQTLRGVWQLSNVPQVRGGVWQQGATGLTPGHVHLAKTAPILPPSPALPP